MNDNEKQQLINDYLAAADHLLEEQEKNQQHQQKLKKDKEIFAQVAADMGLSEEAQAELRQVAEKSLNTAQEHFFKTEFQQCIALAEQSRKLMPYDIRPLELLLRIHTGNHQFAEPEKAKRYAEKIRNIAPQHKEASKILSSPPTSTSKTKSIVALVILGIIVLIGILSTTSNPQPEIHTSEEVHHEHKSESSHHSHKAKKKNTVPFSETNPGELIDHPPVVFLNNTIEGLEFQDKGSKYSLYQDSFGYELRGLVTNNSDQEIKGITATMELLDAKDNAVAYKKFDLRGNYRPALRAGESYGFNELIFHKGFPENFAHPQTIRVTLDSIESNIAAKDISKSETTLHWSDDKPQQFSFRVLERSSPIVQNQFGDDWRIKKTYEITNQGEGVVKHMKLKLEALSSEGSVVGKYESYLISSSSPPMEPKETRLAFFIFTSLEKPSTLRLSVVEYE